MRLTKADQKMNIPTKEEVAQFASDIQQDDSIMALFYEVSGRGESEDSLTKSELLVATVQQRLPDRFKVDSRAACKVLLAIATSKMEG